MKKTIAKYSLILLMAIVFTACPGNEIEQQPKIGEVVTLKYSDSETFFSNSENVAVEFKNVISDNRMSDCSSAYGVFEAEIELSLQYNTKEINIPFTIPGCTVSDQNIYKDTLGYRVFVYRLEPFDVSSVKDNSDYKVKLKIEKL
jgi:hypothetical protein